MMTADQDQFLCKKAHLNSGTEIKKLSITRASKKFKAEIIASAFPRHRLASYNTLAALYMIQD